MAGKKRALSASTEDRPPSKRPTSNITAAMATSEEMNKTGSEQTTSDSKMDTRSPGQQVSDIEIILIEILLYLPVKDMLLAARTCRHWKADIESRPIQEALYFTRKPAQYLEAEIVCLKIPPRFDFDDPEFPYVGISRLLLKQDYSMIRTVPTDPSARQVRLSAATSLFYRITSQPRLCPQAPSIPITAVNPLLLTTRANQRVPMGDRVKIYPFGLRGPPRARWPHGSSCLDMYVTNPPVEVLHITLHCWSHRTKDDMGFVHFEIKDPEGIKFDRVVEGLHDGYQRLRLRYEALKLGDLALEYVTNGYTSSTLLIYQDWEI